VELTTISQSLLPVGDWNLVVEQFVASGLNPDFVLLNECRGWTAKNRARAQSAAADLSMKAMPVGVSASGLATLILYRPETVGEPLPVRAVARAPRIVGYRGRAPPPTRLLGSATVRPPHQLPAQFGSLQGPEAQP
jgi:hypothetical protein